MIVGYHNSISESGMPKTPRKRTRSSPYSSSGKRTRRSLSSALKAAAAALPRMPRTNMLSKQLSKNRPFPMTQRATLRYCTVLDFNLEVATPVISQRYCANGLFDPDDQIGGHQPYGFDQWSAIYDQYMVESSRCVVEVQGISSASADNVVWGINLADTTTATLDLEQLMEQDLSVYRMIDTNVTKLGLGYNAKRFFAGKQLDSLQAGISANPTETAHFHVWAGSTAGGVSNPSNFRLAVTLIYNVVFSERKRFSKS